MLDWIYYLLLLLACAMSLLITILGLPGLWLIILFLAMYGWLTEWDRYVGLTSVLWLLGLAVLAEVVEFLAGAAGSKQAGGRKRGMVGAVIGGIVGGILGTPLLPIIGTIIGACAGAFAGAVAMEMKDRDWNEAMRVGVGAAKGRFYGIIIKLAIGALMVLVVLVAAIPIGGARGTVAPTTAPAALPSSIPSSLPTTAGG